MATLKDVARLAGVSARTVSNVVNDQPYVAEATRARVVAALAALDYQPNQVAKSLRTGRIGLLGFVVPDLSQSHFARLASDIVEAATARGFTVAVDQTHGDLERERRLIQLGPRGAMFDGAIFHPEALRAEDIEHRESQFPLVLIGERVAGDRLDHVYIDDRAAAYEATRRLIDDGHRRIAAIGLRRAAYARTAHLREEGMRQALDEAGDQVQQGRHQYVERYEVSDGYEAMANLVESAERPDAVICFADMLAIGALHRLHELRVAVPEDMAVVGFDDITEASFSYPPLSTIAADHAEIATTAVNALIERITNPGAPIREYVVSHRLVIRQSTRTDSTPEVRN
ncbi:LacI family DNA-binding transcriptional regulator [Occultella gossypii]|uniref:LacI family DNA-binding transcriptional regulator n=1 Tax=Occultella gossypii TaxID=2800820 RepID=A0ABS7S6G8_9MICO|nr:LacI family DNA-binding transcriptional regulator [Occultella gossypii]MBZ2195463.1 LacI family DNA-binding transcriptional regulator [Occultella gossypii]